MNTNRRALCLALALFLCLLAGCSDRAVFPATPEPDNMRIHPPVIEVTATPTPTPAPSISPSPTPFATPAPYRKPAGAFSLSDMRAGDIALNDSLSRVESLLGEPDIRETYTDEVTGASFVTLGYGGLFLHLLDGRTVTRATLNDSTLPGPRGIRVGDSYERVLQVFIRDPEMAAAALDLFSSDDPQPLTLYGEPIGPASGLAADLAAGSSLDPDHSSADGVLPPKAVVDPTINESTGQKEFIIRLIDPAEPYTPATKQDGSYAYQPHGILVFFIKLEDMTVARINWTYSALAE